MGLRSAGPETGRFPGTRDKDFVGRCVRFFERQIELAQPKLIVTLGVEPLRAVVQGVFGISHSEHIIRVRSNLSALASYARTGEYRGPHPPLTLLRECCPSQIPERYGDRS
jgi:hypothetical protein